MKFKIRNLNEPVIEINKPWKMNESNILNEMKILTGLNFDTSKIICYVKKLDENRTPQKLKVFEGHQESEILEVSRCGCFLSMSRIFDS